LYSSNLVGETIMKRIVVSLAIMSAVVMMPVAAAAQTTATGEVTYTKDVAPILYRSCVVCHRTGEIAPMSLMTYEDARPWARSIKTRVSSREMPPWHIDRNIGIQKFKNDRSLTDEEIATIVKWVDSGAPRGNPADMPPAPQFADSSQWQFEPDVVVKYPTYTVPAAGPDLFGSLYAQFGQEEDRYIKAIQTRPVGQGSRQVVHHALSYAVDQDYDDSVDDGTGDGGLFLVEYASGKAAEIYPPDSGVLLAAGRKARVSYHLHSVGEEVKADIELAIAFHPKGTVPKYIRWSKQTAQPNSDIDIPAGTVVRKDGYTRFSKAARITAFQPHTHIRGKYQCLELIYPSQPIRSEVVSCAHWNYNWHMVYNYADDVAPLVPAGTILHVITWHDNSEANRHNPDPKNWTGPGQRTIDEMGFAWIGWYDLTDEAYKEELEARKALQQRATTTDQQQQP
jgi:hypothetical protein